MAVLPMKKIEICAMKRDRKAILEKLQSLGMVEIQTNNEETDDFRKMSTTSQRAKYEKRVQNTDEALQILDKYVPEEKSIFASLEGRQEASEADIQEIIAGRLPILNTDKLFLNVEKRSILLIRQSIWSRKQ